MVSIIIVALICIPATALIFKIYDCIKLYSIHKIADTVVERICAEHAQEIVDCIAAEVSSKVNLSWDDQHNTFIIRAEVTD